MSYSNTLRTWFSKFINFFRLWKKYKHKYRIKKAKEITKKLNEISKEPNYEPRIISYVRKIHPFVFEEMILNIFEKEGFVVIRNKAYSGDGGLDGKVKLGSYGTVLIQCKRYASYINKQDVKEFKELLVKEKCKLGFFIHTGKTGEHTKKEFDNNVLLLSGFTLARILTGQQSMRSYLQSKKLNI